MVADLCMMDNGPGVIPFASESESVMPDHDQYTQELRLASNYDGDINFQTGLFYFDESVTIENYGYNTLAGGALNGYVNQQQDTKAWAVFGSVDYTVSDDLKLTAGLRYSDDEKDFEAVRKTLAMIVNNLMQCTTDITVQQK